MNAEQLLKHYERVAQAPDAVMRLRGFVLDIAVRGKLVPQSDSEESAEVLLRRIASEKARRVKAGELRQTKNLPSPDDPPCALPQSWRWSCLAEIGFISPRAEADDDTQASFVPMPMIAAELGVAHRHEPRKWGEIKKGYTHFAEGDVGLAKITPCFENGKSTVFRNLTGRIGSGTTELHVVRPVLVSPDYVLLFFKSSHFIETGIPRMTGTAGQKRVPAEYFAHSPFPLPPLAEQHRIVGKVAELMALCDRLEAARSQREATRDRLTASTLARLTTPHPPASPDGEASKELSFQSDARFPLKVLPALTTRSDQIKQLRQTILDLAVRGLLVAQDGTDVTAHQLLSRRATLPAGFTRRRKILKDSSVEAPASMFPAIPDSWAYSDIQSLYDLNAIVDYADGNHGALYPRSSEFGNEGSTFVTAKDLVGGQVIWGGCAKLNRERARQLLKGWAQGGDVLLTHNATVGRVARVEDDAEPFLLGTSVTFYRLNAAVIDAGFFYVMLRSSIWQRQLEAIMAQTTRNQVSIQKQAFFRVVVAPLNEQKRIVVKVDELMSLCDQIEASLTRGENTRTRLLNALLHEALAPAEPALEAA